MALIRTIGTTALASQIGKRSKGLGLLSFGAGLVATRIASRSLPGALLVGGAIAAKMLYDRRKQRKQLPD